MRRHPDRLSTTCDEFVLQGLKRRVTRSPKRGPKRRKDGWTRMKYAMVPCDTAIVNWKEDG